MADKKFILISKRKVQRLLELYTLQGRTQEEAARIALKGQNTRGLSEATVARRILHYLGLNMNYRRDYLHEGLTPEIIGRILSNRVLAFPLMIPVEEILSPVMSFDYELENILTGGGRRLKVLSMFKDGLVIALLIFLTYNMNIYVAFSVPLLLFFGLPWAYRGEGEQFKIGDFFMVIIFLGLLVVSAIFQD